MTLATAKILGLVLIALAALALIAGHQAGWW